MTFNLLNFKFKRHKDRYFTDGHYAVLVLIENLKLASILQMLLLGFT